MKSFNEEEDAQYRKIDVQEVLKSVSESLPVRNRSSEQPHKKQTRIGRKRLRADTSDDESDSDDQVSVDLFLK